MSNRGRGGVERRISDREFLDTMCNSALSDIRLENEKLKKQVQKLVDQVRDMKKTVKEKNNTIKHLTDLQVAKDIAIDNLDELCKSSQDQIESLNTEVTTLVDQLDNIVSGYLERARERARKRQRTSSGETTD